MRNTTAEQVVLTFSRVDYNSGHSLIGMQCSESISLPTEKHQIDCCYQRRFEGRYNVARHTGEEAGDADH